MQYRIRKAIIISLTIMLSLFSSYFGNLTVSHAQGIILSPATLPDGEVGTFYSQTITASGGAEPYSFEVTGGSLPNGLSLTLVGVLSGTPTIAGPFNFTITAFDSDGRDASTGYSVEITGGVTIVLSPATLPDGVMGTIYSQTITASGGEAPYTFTVTAGALPDGLTLATDGTLDGTPTATGTFNFTITAADGDDMTGEQAYTVEVTAPPITVNPATLPDGVRNTPYSQTITASGGEAPYTFTVTGGALPDGLTLAGDGTLDGTPTVGGAFNFAITATDNLSVQGGRVYDVFIAQPALVLNPPTLPDGTVGTPYSETFSAVNGTPPYTFSPSGALPDGLSFDDTTLILSGTPTTAGIFNFSMTLQDLNGRDATVNYTVTISAPGIIVNPATLPNGEIDVPYSQTLSASGGTAPYSFAVTSGALPDGLTLASDGTLDGTPTTDGSFNFTVMATDAFSSTGSRSYTVVIGGDAAPPPIPLCEEHNFDKNGVVRSSISDASGFAINCRVLYTNGTPTQWLGGDLYSSANIGVPGIVELGILQAVDIFSPSGQTYFEGGAVFCLRGEGTLIWLGASGMPRHAEIIGSYTVPEFEGFTCVTLFEPGTLVLVAEDPLA